MPRWRPTLSPDYLACARAYGVDLAATLFLYVSISIFAGRVWRFPFDDEIYTLALGPHWTAKQLLLVYPMTEDVHPPLSYLLYWWLQHLGWSEAAMRLVSLALTGLSLVLFQLLTLMWLVRRHGAPVALSSRLIAVLLFGLNGLAVSQGDALRWYPLFAALTAVAVTLYLAGSNSAARLGSAVVLGIAASTNVLAAFVALPLAVYRYGLQRRFCAPFEAAYWLLAGLFGVLGFMTVGSLLFMRYGMVGSQFVGSPIQAWLTDALGFFGGHTLGITDAWMLVPVMVISVLAMVAAIDRRQPGEPVHLLLLMLLLVVVVGAFGFGKSRSFLYLVPVLAAVLTLYFDRLAHAAGRVVLMTALVVAPSIAAIANIRNTPHPFKRQSVIPYQTIFDFINTNGTGRTLVVSTDPVVPWVLSHQPGHTGRCILYFARADTCLGGGRRYDSIFIIAGHNDRSGSAWRMAPFVQAVAQATAGRHKVATLQVGIDDEAALKSRLTGTPLSRHLLTIDLYR